MRDLRELCINDLLLLLVKISFPNLGNGSVGAVFPRLFDSSGYWRKFARDSNSSSPTDIKIYTIMSIDFFWGFFFSFCPSIKTIPTSKVSLARFDYAMSSWSSYWPSRLLSWSLFKGLISSWTGMTPPGTPPTACVLISIITSWISSFLTDSLSPRVWKQPKNLFDHRVVVGLGN